MNILSITAVDQAGVASTLPSFIPTVVLVMLLLLGWAVWVSPKGCEWVAQTLRARAAGLRAYRDVYETMRPRRDGEEIRTQNNKYSIGLSACSADYCTDPSCEAHHPMGGR